MSLRFTKMHGLGNDFIVLDSFLSSSGPLAVSSELAKKLCDRRFGVGADQILWLKKAQSPSADFRMEILNADGSVAEMCGNGIRAVALYVDKRSAKRKTDYRIETLAGLMSVSLHETRVRVDMGIPKLGNPAGERLEIPGQSVHFHEVDVGNPHAVIFVDDVSKVPLEELGPKIENHPRFPKRTNVEFVQSESPGRIRVRVWERGAGVTMACGTGACASAAAAIAAGKSPSPVEVQLPGGALEIEWSGNGKPIHMEGPAVEVFSGEWSGTQLEKY